METLRIIAQEAGISLSEMVGDDPRVISDQREKALIDVFRDLPADKQASLLNLLDSLKQ